MGIDTLADLIREHLDLGKDYAITLETKVTDICEDSLDVLELVMELEEVYDINIANPAKLVTIKDVLEVIEYAVHTNDG